MSDTIKKLFKNKFFLLLLVMVFVTIMILGSLCYLYYFKVKKTIKEESESYISEISKQLSRNISRNIDDNFSALHTIAIALNDSKLDSFDKLTRQIESLQEYWEYKDVLVIDKNATSYDKNGNSVWLTSDEYLQTALIGRRPSMSASEQINGKECIIFVIPVDFKIKNNNNEQINIMGLAVTYGVDSFSQILSMDAFEGKGYSHVIHKNGTVIVRSVSDSAFESGYNILNKLEESSFTGKKLSEIRKDLSLAKSGFSELKHDDISMYMSYISLEENVSSSDWRLVTFVPIADVSNKSTLLVNLTLLMSSFITITFAVLLVIILYGTIKNKRKLERIAYIDSVTSGNTMQKFKEQAMKNISNNKDGVYALLYTNIEKFKILNEQYGRDCCDKLLRAINQGISISLNDDECMGRLFADNFVILIKMENEGVFLRRLRHWKNTWQQFYEQNDDQILPFILEIGIYTVTGDNISLNQMIDRAKLALAGNSPSIDENIRLALYNDELGKAIKREKQLEDIMEQSLNHGEFLVYLQPKYSAVSEKIDGAEALSRWKNDIEGMIYPDEFIPLFEKNGFIQKLDLYVFDVICKMQRRWIDEGKTPIKVSVNCSRVQLKDENFIDKYVEIVNKYNVPFENLEIEFTENIVFDDVDFFSRVINKIKAFGFGCSMDDFGSGYSSLSMIQDIPVDTIKLDKVFFGKRQYADSDRTESVVASIIYMSKALSMIIVAEGVEDEMQVNMLKRLECDLIQGYYFAKPMPIEDFEKLAFATDCVNTGGEIDD